MVIIGCIIVAVVLALIWTQMLMNRRNQNRFHYVGKLHNVGNRKLHIHVSGQSEAPTVVFDHGSEYGASSLTWHMVTERVQHFSRVVTYDRAGYGFSDGGTYPRTNMSHVEDLRQLLLAENIKGPIIIVGHGYGAINARLFAYRYPKQVSGLILVDALHEDEQSGKFLEYYETDQLKRQKRYKGYTVLTYFGLVKGLLRLQSSLRQLLNYYPLAIRKQIWTLIALNKTVKTIANEHAFIEQGFNQLRKVKSYKNIPVTVIIGGKVDDDSSVLKQARYDTAAEMKKLSEQGLLIVAPNSDRHVPSEQPEVVADAIRRMINLIKKEYV
ncbi:alpha/beta fold hydrolase [Paenibacillus endoradicis]|uniref:alpha/beta fold hydrolase n=1 Tax=Paenibacillus endoradicis TaxID=2972487 RepID=UPI002158B473|nr:alpha/beta hydrolase [Paenibacillus endoradicis]MCR8657356.1 alpha/beta hydrolase [Paenibacillus endoradicis]